MSTTRLAIVHQDGTTNVRPVNFYLTTLTADIAAIATMAKGDLAYDGQALILYVYSGAAWIVVNTGLLVGGFLPLALGGTGQDLSAAWSTFTPTLSFGGASVGITYSQQLGRYVQIGKIVHIQVNVNLSSKGSSVGGLSINNLPVTSKNVTGAQPTQSTLAQNMGATITAPPSSIIQANATSLQLYRYVAGALTQLLDTDCTNVSGFFVVGTYEAN